MSEEEPFSDKGINNKDWIKGLNQLVKTIQLMEERASSHR